MEGGGGDSNEGGGSDSNEEGGSDSNEEGGRVILMKGGGVTLMRGGMIISGLLIIIQLITFPQYVQYRHLDLRHNLQEEIERDH